MLLMTNNNQDYIYRAGGVTIDLRNDIMIFPDGDTVQVKRETYSPKIQENLNNFWAVVNGEKTYKEAFPEKE